MLRKITVTQGEKRELALLYLCGIGFGYLSERYGKSRRVLQDTIKYSSRLDDPLIEQFREVARNPKYGQRGKRQFRNSAAIYLVFNGKDIREKELLDIDGDSRIHEIIDSEIYTARLEELKLSVEDALAAPTNPLEEFLYKIFGERKKNNVDEQDMKACLDYAFAEDGYGKKLLLRQLLYEYNSGKEFDLDQIHQVVGKQIIERIKRSGIGVTWEKENVLRRVVESLPASQRKIITDRYLGGRRKSLEEVAEESGIGRHGAIYLMNQALRELRSLPAAAELRQVYRLASDSTVKKAIREAKSSISPDTSVNDFNLGQRLAKCLRSLRIKTLGDLAGKTREELLSEPNFGEASLAEAEEILSYGKLKLMD